MILYTTNNSIETANRSATGIQIGDSTHHQDQSMTPTSFKMIKVNRSAEPNPIPPEVVFSLFMF